MILVIDASVAVKWFAPEPLHELARALLQSSDQRVAPDWLLIEVANVLWKQQRRGSITSAEASRILDLLRQLLTLHAGTELVAAASDIANALDHPVYDCLYLALADNIRGQLVTADQGLAAKASDGGYDCRFLGDTRTSSTRP